MMKTFSQNNNGTLSERKKKRLEKRIEKCINILRNDRDNYKLHIELGDSYSLLNQSEQSDKHYTSAIEILHQSTVDEKKRKQIIMLYGKILNQIPDKYEAYAKLGEEYIAAGQKDKASRFLLSSAKKAFDSGDYSLALQCYNQVIDMGKSNPYIIERCTEIYLTLGQKDKAIENYMQIGDAYVHGEKFIEALEYYKKADAIESQNPELMLKIARMYYALEWKENAATELIKLAEYHEKLRSYSEALKYYQHSLSLDRDNEKALKGKQRIAEIHTIDKAWEGEKSEKTSQEDILEELDQLEEVLKEQHLLLKQEKASGTERKSTPAALNNEHSEMDPMHDEEHLLDFPEKNSSIEPPDLLKDRMLDMSLEEDFIIEAGLEDLQLESSSQENSEQEPKLSLESSREAESETDYSSFESFQLDGFGIEQEQTGEDTGKANTVIEAIPEETIANIPEELHFDYNAEMPMQQVVSDIEEPDELPHLPAPSQDISQVEELDKSSQSSVPQENISDESSQLPEPQEEASDELLELSVPLEESSDELLQLSTPQEEASDELLELSVSQDERTGESLESPTSQEKAADGSLELPEAQEIEELRMQETSIQQEFETAKKDKEELEHRLDELTATDDTFDDTRYEAIITKIQNKKQLLQEHLNKILKQREKNGRFLAEELEQLSSTKRRLRDNLEYIQQVKTRVEEKVNVELHQARQQIQDLSTTAKELGDQLGNREQVERDLQQQFEQVNLEKEALQEQFSETIASLTGENDKLGKRLKKLSLVKSESEKTLKKKLKAVYHSYQRLKTEHKSSIESKEEELNRTAQRLSEFADDYVKLETTLGEIRNERDKLNKMLVKETATRTRLEEKLIGIENQVDSLEIQGTELLVQLEQELDRQFSIKQNTSNEFQGSLEEFETLLSLQEREIQSLEAL